MRSKLVVCLVVVAVLCLALALPVGAQQSALISAGELKTVLGSNGLVVIDVRGSDAYEAGHIPGAILVPEGDFKETIGGVKSMATSPETLSALLGKNGISKNSRVVIYSAGKDIKYATRVWWVLDMYGHQQAQVLDGGIDAWTASGYEVSTGPVVPVPAEYSLAATNVNQQAVATMAEVVAARAAGMLLIDCRSDSYFLGKESKTTRGGHIEGAVNFNESANLNPDNTFKSAGELAQLYAAIGITADTPVIVYCNTGTSSSVNYFALTQILGYTKVQNYDGSLTEWSADPKMPMVSKYDFFTIGSVDAEVNATRIKLSTAPFMNQGRVFITADALATSLGAKLAVSGKTITLSAGQKSLQLDVGDTMIMINGKSNEITVAPVTQDGIVLLPVRWVAEAFGAELGWNAEKKVVSVYVP